MDIYVKDVDASNAAPETDNLQKSLAVANRPQLCHYHTSAQESQRSETGTPPPTGVTSRKAMLCQERGAPFGPPQNFKP